MPELDQPTFVACNGAKTPAFLASADAAGHPEWDAAMGRFNLVTFTFGGDNIDFSGIITQCIEGSHKAIHKSDPGHTCPADNWIRGRIAQELTTKYQQFLLSVAEQVIVPGGNIVVLGYPELIELPKFWPFVLRHAGVCEGMGTGDATQLRGDAADLNATLGHDIAVVNAEHPNGVHLSFLDVNSGSTSGPIKIPATDPNLFEPSSGPRHNLCGTGVGWMNGISTGAGRSTLPRPATSPKHGCSDKPSPSLGTLVVQFSSEPSPGAALQRASCGTVPTPVGTSAEVSLLVPGSCSQAVAVARYYYTHSAELSGSGAYLYFNGWACWSSSVYEATRSGLYGYCAKSQSVNTPLISLGSTRRPVELRRPAPHGVK